MTSRFGITIGVALFAMTVGLGAQATSTTKEAGATQVTTEQITGEVVLVDNNILLARMQPSGQYRMFNIQSSQQFMIDGKSKRLADLTPGTFLTATAITTTQPITIRTNDRHQRHGVVCPGQLRDPHNRQWSATGITVPDSFTFTAEGKPATVKDLRKGMKVSATKIVAEPTHEISKEIVITGKGPK